MSGEGSFANNCWAYRVNSTDHTTSTQFRQGSPVVEEPHCKQYLFRGGYGLFLEVKGSLSIAGLLSRAFHVRSQYLSFSMTKCKTVTGRTDRSIVESTAIETQKESALVMSCYLVEFFEDRMLWILKAVGCLTGWSRPKKNMKKVLIFCGDFNTLSDPPARLEAVRGW